MDSSLLQEFGSDKVYDLVISFGDDLGPFKPIIDYDFDEIQAIKIVLALDSLTIDSNSLPLRQALEEP